MIAKKPDVVGNRRVLHKAEQYSRKVQFYYEESFKTHPNLSAKERAALAVERATNPIQVTIAYHVPRIPHL